MCTPLIIDIYADDDLGPAGPKKNAVPVRHVAYLGGRWFTPRTGTVEERNGWTRLRMTASDWAASEWESLAAVSALQDAAIQKCNQQWP